MALLLLRDSSPGRRPPAAPPSQPRASPPVGALPARVVGALPAASVVAGQGGGSDGAPSPRLRLRRLLAPLWPAEEASSSPPDSIPIPRSHVRRTRSEIQLAEETRRAEDVDAQMFARIVAGLQLQFHKNKGAVHPLSQRSLEGVVRTKGASHEDLARRGEGHVRTKKAHDEDLTRQQGGRNDEWEVSFLEDRDDNDGVSRWATKTAPPSPDAVGDAETSRGSVQNQDEGAQDGEGGCIFVLAIVQHLLT